MTRDEELDLLTQMIDSTQKQIQKKPKDKIQLQAELTELQNELFKLQKKDLKKYQGRRRV